MRRVWIIPACFYAVGVAVALVLVALITLGFPALGLRYGLAIVCILLVAFISAAVAYARAPSRRRGSLPSRHARRNARSSPPCHTLGCHPGRRRRWSKARC